MAHVPDAGFCGTCGFELIPEKNTILLEAVSEGIGPYYKIMSDLYKCSNPYCTTRVYRVANGPVSYHHQENYDTFKSEVRVAFAPRKV